MASEGDRAADSILIKLDRPSFVAIDSMDNVQGPDDGCGQFEARLSLWASFYGLLSNRESRELVGIVFFVCRDDIGDAERLLSECDPNLVQLVSSDSREAAAYAAGDEEGMFLELLWAHDGSRAFIMELLDITHGNWLYYKDERLYGYLLDDIDWVLETHGVTFPRVDRLRAPLRE